MLSIWNDVHHIIDSVSFIIVLLDQKALGY